MVARRRRGNPDQRERRSTVSEGGRSAEHLEVQLRVFDEGDLSAQEETELFQQLLDTGQIDELPERYKEIARDFQREGRVSFPEEERE
jgi:hypothetical protein